LCVGFLFGGLCGCWVLGWFWRQLFLGPLCLGDAFVYGGALLLCWYLPIPYKKQLIAWTYPSQQYIDPLLFGDFIFKLVEEETPALLLHLPEVLVETTDLPSAVGLGCLLVVASPQATAEKTAVF
jgi:hypothetical protein